MLKRLFDFTATVAGGIVISPILAGIAVVVRVKHGKPVLFRQQRPGLHGEPFLCLKFRTMTNEVDDKGELLPDNRRLTGLGAFLRRTSLDELPELWNVVKGEMSLVGPRPLRMEYLPLYTEEQARRHEVKPGITGWAQVRGRNAISWEEKFDFDIWYVDNRSFLLDLRILLLTFIKVVKREGINASEEEPMPEFTGSNGES